MSMKGSLAERARKERAGWLAWLSAGDRWIPLAFVAGFLVMLAANGIMIFVAFDSWTGLSVSDAYRKGLAYNEALSDAQAQAALGWRVEAAYRRGADGAGSGRVEVRLSAADGGSLASAEVSAVLRRPGRADLDRAQVLEWQNDGVFTADVALPTAGLWDLDVEVAKGGNRHRSRHRVLVAP
jgi:nitrogen fixation protein FixH